METNYHFSNTNLVLSRRFFDDLDTSSIASCTNAKIQELLNKISLHSQPLKYSTDKLDREYIDRYKSLKVLIRWHFPNLKAEKMENPRPVKIETLAADLEAADELLKACVTKNERAILNGNIVKNVNLADLIFLAKTGHASAQYFLGQHIVDSYAGLKWLKKAAAQENPNAMFLLYILENNIGLVEKAALQGHVGAKISLLVRNKWDKNDILIDLMRAYEMGNREDDLFSFLGRVYEGWGDYNSALKWYGQIRDTDTKQYCMRNIINSPPWDAT